MTVQVMTSGGQAVRNRQLYWPTETGGRGSTASRRTEGRSPVDPDDQVVMATAAVVEADLDGPVEVLQRPDGAAQLHRQALAEDLVQLGPGQGQAGTDAPPQLMEVDVGEQVPAVVEEALTGDPGPTGGHSALQAQGAQGTDTVGGQVDASPGATPAGFSFDHLGGESGLAQGSGQGQTG
jgi:hypothetical protein